MTRKIYLLVLTLIYYGQAMSQHNQYWAQNEIPGTERTSQLYSNEFTPFQSSNHFTGLSSSMHSSGTLQNRGQSGHGGHGTSMHNSGTFQNHGQSGHGGQGGHGTSAIGNAWRHVVDSFKNPKWKDYSKYH